ncbi:MAG TPA: transposase [Terriglobales bacterium]|nr:transposase [Terriglobales bacterium]
MGRIQRPTHRVVTEAQRQFGFVREASEPQDTPESASADDHFIDDTPTIEIGDVSLEKMLVTSGMGWVIQLRRILHQLDYSLLIGRYSRRGRKAFHPRTVIGLIIYGLFRKRSALRELEDLSVLDIGAWWICGGRRIDHSTIGSFVRMHEEALGDDFLETVTAWVVRQLKLKPGISTIDGTVVESAASRWRAIKAEAAIQEAKERQEQAENNEKDCDLQAQAAVAQEIAEKAEERIEMRQSYGRPTDTATVVVGDLDAVVQPRKDGVKRPAYKVSTMMLEGQVIVGQYVHPSSEKAAVEPLLEQYERVVGGLPTRLLMDAGLHSPPILAALCERGIDTLCPSGQAFGDDDWQRKSNGEKFSRADFRYDQQTDTYVCPAKAVLKFQGTGSSRGQSYRTYGTDQCAKCELRDKCTTDKRGRHVKRMEGAEYSDAMAAVLEQPRARELYRRRMALAEPVHAELRERFGLRRFRRRGLRMVRAEFALYCLAFNLKRVLGKAMIAAVIVHRDRLGRMYVVAIVLRA